MRMKTRRSIEIFEAELKKRGITCKMKKMVPWCTGEAGAESAKALFLDEHGESHQGW